MGKHSLEFYQLSYDLPLTKVIFEMVQNIYIKLLEYAVIVQKDEDEPPVSHQRGLLTNYVFVGNISRLSTSYFFSVFYATVEFY